MQIRVQSSRGNWVPLEVTPIVGDRGLIRVPSMKGEWMLSPDGSMVANVGGNDPWIYTIHPDDGKAAYQATIATA